METSVLQVASSEQQDRMVSTLIAAFLSDPVMRYMWPEAHGYLNSFPVLVDGFGGGAFTHEGADATEDFAGGALWLPPDVHPDVEQLVTLLMDSVVETRRDAMLSVLEQMDAAHPQETHWHLAFIGTDAAQQGRGVGSVLMKDRLAKTDALGHHTYLESTNPRNVSFYQRFGFEVVGEIQAGDSPVMTPMVRSPR